MPAPELRRHAELEKYSPKNVNLCYNKEYQKTEEIKMLYQIIDGTVSAGGNLILSHINFEIRGNEKIAVVGSNGAGKTILLKLIAGEITLDRDDK